MVPRPHFQPLNGAVHQPEETYLSNLHEAIPPESAAPPSDADLDNAQRLQAAYQHAITQRRVIDLAVVDTNLAMANKHVESLVGARAMAAAVAALAGGGDGGGNVEGDAGIEAAMAPRGDPHLTALGAAVDRLVASQQAGFDKLVASQQAGFDKLGRKVDKLGWKVDKLGRRTHALHRDALRQRSKLYLKENRQARKLVFANGFNEISKEDLEALCTHYGLSSADNLATVRARVRSYIHGTNMDEVEAYPDVPAEGSIGGSEPEPESGSTEESDWTSLDESE